MSKIIYRKVRTAPGLKLTDPTWEQNAAYYAKAVSIETMNQRDMAKHITSHGSPYTVDVVVGVLEAYRNCLIEQLLESKKVKVEGLGTFYVTIANKEGGIKNLDDFNIGTLAQGLRLRFLPDASQEENISSKEFLKKAKFVDLATLTKDNDVEDEEGGDNDGSQNSGNSQAQSVAAPTITGDTPFADTSTVTITAEQGAEIRYTTDGSTPTASSTLYSSSITLSDTATVKAIAIKNGTASEVTTKAFVKSSGNGGGFEG